MVSTYDHRVWKTGLPVRSAVLKPHAGRLVVGWVTTSESRLLYVFLFLLHVQYCVVVYLEEGGRGLTFAGKRQ